MHHNFVRLILLAIIIIMVISNLTQLPSHRSNTVFACECTIPKPPDEALIESDTVFSGKVTGVYTDDSGMKISFDVDKAWKGISNDTVSAVTGLGSADCGYPFEEGKEYLVYTYGGGESLYTSGCSRTKPLSEAEQDLKVLGVGYVPMQSTAISGTQVDNYSFPFIAGFGIVVAGIIAYLMLTKRRM